MSLPCHDKALQQTARGMEQPLYDYLCQFLTPKRLAGFERVLAGRTRFLAVGLENLYQPHNASACLRSCDCFGVQDVHVIESDNVFRPNVDVALGASKWVDVHRYCPPADTVTASVRRLQAGGFRVVGTSPHSEQLSIAELPLDRPTVVFFGSEKDGLSDEFLAAADDCAYIPMAGFTESLNISVAVAVTLYELTTRLRRERDDWGLTESEIHDLRQRWVARSLGDKLEPLVKRFQDQRDSAGNSLNGNQGHPLPARSQDSRTNP